MSAVRTSRKSNNGGSAFLRVSPIIVQLSNPWFSIRRVICKVNKSAFDIKITGTYSIFTLFCRELKIVSWNEQMYFFHPAVHQLTGIMPQIYISMEPRVIFKNIPFEEQRTATSIIIKFVYHTTTMGTSSITIR